MREGEKRKTHILSLTPEGMVMLVFEDDIGKNGASYKNFERAYEEFLDMLTKVAKKMRSEVKASFRGLCLFLRVCDLFV